MRSENSLFVLVRAFWNLGPLTRARAGMPIVGVLLPYVARIPGTFVHGSRWLDMYLFDGLDQTLWIQIPSALVWGTLFGLSFTLRKVSALILPSLACFGFLAWVHAVLDVSGYGGIGLVYIPIFGVPIVLVTFFLAVVIWGPGPRAD